MKPTPVELSEGLERGTLASIDPAPLEVYDEFPDVLVVKDRVLRLADRAVPRSRAKRLYAALAGAEDHESPFGGTTCT